MGRAHPFHKQLAVYENLMYKLSLKFPSGYPYNAPMVEFLIPYHPIVDIQDSICLDIPKDKGSALYDVRTILLSIQSLLGESNINSPLNTHATALWEKSLQLLRSTCKEPAPSWSPARSLDSGCWPLLVSSLYFFLSWLSFPPFLLGLCTLSCDIIFALFLFFKLSVWLSPCVIH